MKYAYNRLLKYTKQMMTNEFITHMYVHSNNFYRTKNYPNLAK